MNKLPMGWVEVELGDLGSIHTGKTPSTKDKDNFGGDVLFVKPADLDNGGYIYETADYLSEKGLAQLPHLPKNSIMVTCIGNLGKVGITTQICTTNQQINSIIPDENLVNYKFLYYQILTLKNWLEKNSSATTVSIINKTKFSKAPIYLPPKAEQDHIATLLDNHLSQVATIRQKLNDILPIIKQFRQSVLAQAVSGKLLADLDFENWQRLTINDVSFKCKQRKPDDTEQFTYIDIASIDKDFKKITNPQILLGKDAPSRARKIVNGGDVIVSLTRPNLNAVALVNLGFDEQIASTGFEVLKPKESILSYFLFLIVQTNHFVNAMVEKTQGALYPAIKSADVQSYEINLPPLLEQQQIVTEVERLFALADSIETQVKEALERVGHLTQSILHQAFTGNLSADWRACNADLITGEHSATALLAQIQASTKAKTTKRPTKKTRP